LACAAALPFPLTGPAIMSDAARPAQEPDVATAIAVAMAAMPAVQARPCRPAAQARMCDDRADAAAPTPRFAAPWPPPPRRLRCGIIAGHRRRQTSLQHPADLTAPHQTPRRPAAARTAEAAEESIA
jgi:hypothetical protein